MELPADAAAALEKRAKDAGLSAGEMLRCEALAHLGAADVAPLTIPRKHELIIRRAAAMLEIPPQEFAEWCINVSTEDMFPGTSPGVEMWADIITYPDAETAARVEQRIAALLKRRGIVRRPKVDPGVLAETITRGGRVA